MITLRRNDKIIIIVGVLILLIAGAGVALYSPSVTPPSTPSQEQSTWMTYSVTWHTVNASLSQIEGNAPKGTGVSTPVTINQANLKSVSFRLQWVDDKALLRRFGLDTLTLSIKTPDNKTTSFSDKSASRSKAGDFSINVSTKLVPPKRIQANNTQDAEKRLEAMFKSTSWTNKPINVTVTVKIGERFPLRFRDKGNHFTLDVNYSYYSFTFKENMTGTGLDDLPPDFPSETSDWTPPYMSMIIGTGCGRYV